jgi:hypothetical protein
VSRLPPLRATSRERRVLAKARQLEKLGLYIVSTSGIGRHSAPKYPPCPPFGSRYTWHADHRTKPSGNACTPHKSHQEKKKRLVARRYGSTPRTHSVVIKVERKASTPPRARSYPKISVVSAEHQSARLLRLRLRRTPKRPHRSCDGARTSSPNWRGSRVRPLDPRPFVSV